MFLKNDVISAIESSDSLAQVGPKIGIPKYSCKRLKMKRVLQDLDLSETLLDKFIKPSIKIGKTYNFITVLSSTKINKVLKYQCKCECGTELILNSGRVAAKGHCGCKINYDFSGQKIGKITVLEKIPTIGKYNKYKCLCDCGNETVVTYYRLIRNDYRPISCGCIEGKFKKRNKSYQGIGDLSGALWCKIKNCKNRKTRILDFTISIEYAWDLYLKQNKRCAISGLPIMICDTSVGIKRTASLDRINSAKGYVDGNVQWVHTDINIMKMNHGEEYFLNLCKTIVEYQEGKRL